MKQVDTNKRDVKQSHFIKVEVIGHIIPLKTRRFEYEIEYDCSSNRKLS